MRLTLLVAAAENGVIGRDGALPWRLPEDLRRFRRLTWGHHLLMGRRTFDSIGRALPGRTSLVLTRSAGGRTPLTQGSGEERGRACFHDDLAAALRQAREAGEDELFVVGGEEVYRLTAPIADRLLLTRVHAQPPGDACLPEIDPTQWVLIGRERHEADARHAFAYSFEEYRRDRGLA
jgi:dihydrofolate reductase